MPRTSEYLYVRLIGDRSILDSNFGRVSKKRSDLIKYWAKKIQMQKFSLAMIMANNHFEGFAPASANTLRLELGMSKLVWEENKQKN